MADDMKNDNAPDAPYEYPFEMPDEAEIKYGDGATVGRLCNFGP